MGVSFEFIKNLVTRTKLTAEGNADDLVWNLGDGGDSATGGDGSAYTITLGDGGTGTTLGGDGGALLIIAGAGGDGVTNGDGGDGGSVQIYSGSEGSGAGTGSDGSSGSMYLYGRGGLYLNTAANNGSIISGTTSLDVDLHHRGQMSIGDSSSNPGTVATSVAVDFRGTTTAPLLPRLSTAQRNALTAQDGMIIYNTTLTATQVRNNGSWVDVPGSGSGEANTASNAGSGTSLYYQKTGVDLEFNGIKSENDRLTVSLDGVTHDIELTVNEGNIVHQNLSGAGTNTHAQIDTHIASTSNPHSTDIGNIGSGTLAELNSAITDATLDDSSSSRTPTAHASSHQNGGGDEISVSGLSGQLADGQKVAVSKNSGATVGTRSVMNFIEGSNVTLTITDDAGGDEVDITVAAAGGGDVTGPGSSTDSAIALYDGTGGDTLKDSSVTIASSIVDFNNHEFQNKAYNSINDTLGAGNNNDWSPTGWADCDIVRITGASGEGTSDITGAAAITEGSGTVVKLLLNVSTDAFDIVHESASSTAANRFYLPKSSDLRLYAYSGVHVWYDPTSSRWKVIDPADLGHDPFDPDAIHDNVGNEINNIAEKTTAVANDLFVIEDSAASYAKKKFKYNNFTFLGYTGSSTDNAITRWSGSGGSSVQNSGAILDDSNNISGLVNVTNTGYYELTDMSAPGNPGAGLGRLYKKTSDDGLFWKPDAAGPEVDLTASGSGTVTSVAAGNGMDFTTITSSGSVTMGTPGTLTSATSNGVTATSHTHDITTGIADTNILRVDHVTPVDNDYAKFTANGIEGRSYSEVRTDLSLVPDTDFYSKTSEDTWRNNVSQTEMGYLDGVTSDIQTQFGTKVTGPGSSVDNTIARYDSTTGKLIQGSGITISDGDDITGSAGGMTITGGTGSGDDLTLVSTSHGTKGTVILGAGTEFDASEEDIYNIETATFGSSPHAASSSSGSLTIDLNNRQMGSTAMTENITSITITAPRGIGTFQHIVTQHASTGPYTLPAASSWNSGAVRFVNDVAPNAPSAASEVLILTILYDGTNIFVWGTQPFAV